MRQLHSAGFGQPIGLGDRPAMIVIDAQRYMVAPDSTCEFEYPSSCGQEGRDALATLSETLADLRARDVPVFYTRFELSPDGSDVGVYGRKRPLLQTEHWCLAGTSGAEIHPDVAPQSGDQVLVKKRPSAFFGTHLTSLLLERAIDTVILAGGSTSNCVRATAVDSMSFGFRTVVLEDCVFDRQSISHEVALFDLERQAADVMTAAEAISALDRIHAKK
ncbi:MAG: isochorismatase family protein [Acidimicrobiales bacterium]